jgi:UDP-N-acetylmuramoyl-tripeptide--D-alanyl-D-alanine ligase
LQALTLGEFAQRCGGELVNADPSMQLLDFALDHREVAPGSLFLCIVGANFDGHTVAREAINQGAVACLSEQDLGEIPHIRVQNLVEALANYGSSCRSEFSRPVLAITGSNGKTSTKSSLMRQCRHSERS